MTATPFVVFVAALSFAFRLFAGQGARSTTPSSETVFSWVGGSFKRSAPSATVRRDAATARKRKDWGLRPVTSLSERSKEMAAEERQALIGRRTWALVQYLRSLLTR